MASEEMRARDKAIQNRNHFKARGAGPPQSETNMFRCGKCGNRKTTYYQMQVKLFVYLLIYLYLLISFFFFFFFIFIFFKFFFLFDFVFFVKNDNYYY